MADDSCKSEKVCSPESCADNWSDLVDELITPGCPRCAVKHLTAALTYLTAPVSCDGSQQEIDFKLSLDGCPGSVAVAKAHINLIEVLEGYWTHLPFAVGWLQVAEENLVAEPIVDTIRHIRCRLIMDGTRDAIADAAFQLADILLSYRYARTIAHVDEALRELPPLSHPDHGLMKRLTPSNPVEHDDIMDIRRKFAEYVGKSVEWINDEYFKDN